MFSNAKSEAEVKKLESTLDLGAGDGCGVGAMGVWRSGVSLGGLIYWWSFHCVARDNSLGRTKHLDPQFQTKRGGSNHPKLDVSYWISHVEKWSFSLRSPF